ncbi:DUF3298 domain-containing protein [Paenibacillus albicereus]|uniref:DUF3298 domain-containing protein n=1 Tax=Paenibacillus albicereus TaxID=2726185 RepID=A0A6H2H2M1_9BACL|nr:DUF4163 domain-containing protein [Paenibacillus albicereus]QJC53885.1 DUF3298 domain-containing protein [Paenibacillus albicereus]
MNDRTHRGRHVRRLMLAVAGGVLLGGSTLGSPAPFAAAAAATPAPAENAVHPAVAVKKIVRSTKAYEAALSIPVVSGLKDAKYQQRLNGILESSALQELETAAKQAEEDLASSLKEKVPFRKHEIKLQFSAARSGTLVGGGFLSLKLNTYLYSGGAHGISRIDTYNIANGPQASPLTLETLYGEAYAERIDKEIKRQIQAHPELYFEDGFTGVKEDQPFYISGGKIRIVFQPYEIAPYATGAPEFPIALPEAGSAEPMLAVQVQGQTLDGIGVTQSKDGVAMIPVRQVAEALGYKTKWTAKTSTLELSKGDTWTAVSKGLDSYSVDKSAPVRLGAAPALDGKGRLTVPLALFTELLQATVSYSGDVVNLEAPKT